MEDVCEGKDFSFPSQEESILKLWNSIDAFKTQLKRTESMPEYVFYDGPPFATGKPHYGHILAGTIKDIITRYQSMNGRHVTRRFGWDCHGLPVEFEIDTKLGIKSRAEVLAMGIDKYNEECRGIVTRYVAEWEEVITRTGRWIDFKNDYKTMDIGFMESVWWVFAQLYNKGLVYRGFKVMPYSTGCKTPLANFEAGLNYKDVSDPAIMASFPIIGDRDNAALVAWTTTPWTLPSNLALCVNENFDYVKVRDKLTGSTYIVAESRLSQLPVKKPKVDVSIASKNTSKKSSTNSKSSSKDTPDGKTKCAKDIGAYDFLEKVSGASLVGMKYAPLFDYFKEFSEMAFRVVADNYVTDDSGTGVVHCAPAFGEDDYRVCVASGIIRKDEELIVAIDADGCFTDRVSDFHGRYVKDADKDIINAVKAKGRLVSSGNIMHSYPFCWRSETPLLYMAIPSWFVSVEQIKDKLLESNKQTYWVPDYVKEKRFHNWLENARDWAVSRSRFWGTPLPVWISEDGEEKVVIDSIDKLEQLSGVKATDLHRHHIDGITIPSNRGPEFGMLHRVDDVFDCWFESGSMPYAYIHYPFENVELFEKNFPGHFVAEGLDQTRGWFYTLMVLSTALFGKPAFRNLICNGLVLAEDGKKMSKRLKNYPSPMEVIGEYGADALRLYLINSPVVRAESLKFKKDGVFSVVKDVFLPWYNAYRFLVQNAKRLEIEGSAPFIPIDRRTLQLSSNVLDQWINSATESLVHFVRQEMEAYRLYTVVPYLLKFIDNLTNIYVRFNRKRLKGRTGEEDCRISLSTLYHVLLTTCVAMAPITPFFTEVLYQNLRKATNGSEESVHYCSFPSTSGKIDERIEQSVTRMITVIDLARNIRERHNKPLKAPLKEMVVVHPDAGFLEDITGILKEYVMEELNVKAVVPCSDLLKYASLRAEPDFSVLGKRLGRAMGIVSKEVKAMSQADILAFEKSGEVTFSGHCLKLTDIKVVREFKCPADVTEKDIDAAGDGDVLVILDLRADESLFESGIAREVINRTQKLRKKAGLEPTDIVEVYYEPLNSDHTLERVVKSQERYIKDALGSHLLPHTVAPDYVVVFCREEFHGVSGLSFAIGIARPAPVFDSDAILDLYSGNKKLAEGLQTYLLSRDLLKLKAEFHLGKGKMEVKCVMDQPVVDIEVGESYICLLCSELMEAAKPLTRTGATLIVCPAPILAQWHSEITRHTRPSSLKVCIYEGARNLTSSIALRNEEKVLATADIVLTTYDVLKEDLSHDSDRHKGDRHFMRFQKRYPVIPTLLTRIHWWRVCLDEAQMVECNTASVTEMAMRLSAQHRWCITGTPLQRKLDDIYALLRFLRASPFDIYRWWVDVIRDPYESGDIVAMEFVHRFFKHIMWRSSKVHVSEELELPSQEECVLWLTLSAIEEHFYQKQHETCVTYAHEIIRSCKSEITSSNTSCRAYLSHIEAEKLLFPLLKLRQACCHPQVGSYGLCSLQHSPLTMEEILDVLIGKAKVEGEEALRIIVVALNGLAGIAILEQDSSRAVSLYKEALTLADENCNDFRLDPLLSIHILHNLAQLIPITNEYIPQCSMGAQCFENNGNGKTTDPARFARHYVKRRKINEESKSILTSKVGDSEDQAISCDDHHQVCSRCFYDGCLVKTCENIKQKYLSLFLSKLSLAQQEFKNSYMQVCSISKECKDQNMTWWLHALNIIEESKDSSNELLEKIDQAVTRAASSSRPVKVSSRIRSIIGLKYTIQSGLDSLETSRQTVISRIMEIDQTMGKPNNEDIERKRYCSNCYNGNGSLCINCELDQLFQIYEAGLFLVKKAKSGAVIASEDAVEMQKQKAALNRFFRDSEMSIKNNSDDAKSKQRHVREEIQVSKNPSPLEIILGVVKSFSAKMLGRQGVASARKHLLLFEAMRKEYAHARCLSVAQSQFLGAHDEIIMATSRMRLKETDEEPNSVMVLSREELVSHSLQYSSDKFLSLTKLSHIKGQLRYLKGLVVSNHKVQDRPQPLSSTVQDSDELSNSSLSLKDIECITSSDEESCPICHEKLGNPKMVFPCGHLLCCKCCLQMTEKANNLQFRKSLQKWIMCPTCRQRADTEHIAYVDERKNKYGSLATPNDLQAICLPENSIAINGSYGTKIESVTRRILWITSTDQYAKVLVFSSWNDVLDVLSHALDANSITYVRMKGGRKSQEAIAKFKGLNSTVPGHSKTEVSKPIKVLLMLIQHGANGLNILEAQHVILVEPLLNPAVEAQAISRVHRVGQEKQTFVHRFIVKNSVEESIYKLNRSRNVTSIVSTKAKNKHQHVLTVQDVESLFPMTVPAEESEDAEVSEGSLRHLPPAVAAGLAAERRMVQSENNTT